MPVAKKDYFLFSYGSNSPRQLQERLGHPVLGTGGYVEGYLRAFRGWSNTWVSGVATLIPAKDTDKTYGYVARVSLADLNLLDQYEGVPRKKYARKIVDVTLQTGETVSATTYVSTSEEVTAPSRLYLSAVAETISAFWTGTDGSIVTAADITIRNPREDLRTAGKVVIIGIGERWKWQLDCAKWSRLPQELVRLIDAGKVVHFDMSQYPERGDAIDHLERGAVAVIAYHLFGVAYDEGQKRTAPDYFYNKQNWLLRTKCKELGIPLFAFGEQPDNSDTDFKVYTNPKKFITPLGSLCTQRIEEAQHTLNVRFPLTWDICSKDGQTPGVCSGATYDHFNKPRGFGVTFQQSDGRLHIRLAPKLEQSPEHRQDGIIRHELGHVIDLHIPERLLNPWCARRGVTLPPKSQGEIRADAIAHAVWGTPLKYDADTVQSTKIGIAKRPPHLGL